MMCALRHSESLRKTLFIVNDTNMKSYQYGKNLSFTFDCFFFLLCRGTNLYSNPSPKMSVYVGCVFKQKQQIISLAFFYYYYSKHILR